MRNLLFAVGTPHEQHSPSTDMPPRRLRYPKSISEVPQLVAQRVGQSGVVLRSSWEWPQHPLASKEGRYRILDIQSFHHRATKSHFPPWNRDIRPLRPQLGRYASRKIYAHSTSRSEEARSCQHLASIKLRLEATARQRLELPVNVRETLERCEAEGLMNTPEYCIAMTEFYSRHLCRVNPFPKELLESMAAMQQDDTVQSTLMGPSPFNVSGAMKDFDIRGELSQITEQTVPGGILNLNGKFDTTQDEVTAPFFTQPRARVKWVRFAESSHMAMLEETESFLAALQGFLEMP